MQKIRDYALRGGVLIATQSVPHLASGLLEGRRDSAKARALSRELSGYSDECRPTGGFVKLMASLTMGNISEAVAAEGLATQWEIEAVVAELRDFASTLGTVQSLPRIVQAWGWRSR